MSKQNQLKNRVYKFWENNKLRGKRFVVDHFLAEKESESTIYRLIYEAENQVVLERKKGSGRPVVVGTKSNIKQLTQMFDHKTGCSQKNAAKKFKTTQQHISWLLKTKTNVKCRLKKKKPLRNNKQEAAMRPKCRKLASKYKSYQFIQDDESYFTLSNTTLAGNNIFYSSDTNLTAENVKYSKKAKYEKKIMIWIAISPMGVSQPYYVPSGMAINKETYLKKCIQERLMPFYKKYHQHTKTVFWPDLASSHYAKVVQNYLREQKVDFVPKCDNPAATPEARSIEDFWADLKREVYKKNWSAKNIIELKQRIKNCLRKMDVNNAKERASETLPRLNKIARYGL
jgi:hypothetical protein